MQNEVVLFGCGVCFQREVDRIKTLCSVKYVVDNDCEKWGKIFGSDVKCISINQLKEMSPELVLICVDNADKSIEIAKQLNAANIYKYDHYMNFYKYFNVNI